MAARPKLFSPVRCSAIAAWKSVYAPNPDTARAANSFWQTISLLRAYDLQYNGASRRGIGDNHRWEQRLQDAALVAEQANIDNLNLAPAKRRLKEERLLGIARANSISGFPPVPEGVDDADIRETFLAWATETEQ